MSSTHEMEQRFLERTGYGTLGHIVAQLVDHDDLSAYDQERIIEVVEMAPDFFWDRFVRPMMDGMAQEIERGFHSVDMEDDE